MYFLSALYRQPCAVSLAGTYWNRNRQESGVVIGIVVVPGPEVGPAYCVYVPFAQLVKTKNYRPPASTATLKR